LSSVVAAEVAGATSEVAVVQVAFAPTPQAPRLVADLLLKRQ